VYVDSLTVINRRELAPVTGAKLKSKTHLLNRFFDCYNRFSRVLCQSLEKVLIEYYNNKKLKIKKGIKNAEFHTDFKTAEKS
jgi:hypothetical protein